MPRCDSSETYTRAVWPEPSPAVLRLTFAAGRCARARSREMRVHRIPEVPGSNWTAESGSSSVARALTRRSLTQQQRKEKGVGYLKKRLQRQTRRGTQVLRNHERWTGNHQSPQKLRSGTRGHYAVNHLLQVGSWRRSDAPVSSAIMIGRVNSLGQFLSN